MSAIQQNDVIKGGDRNLLLAAAQEPVQIDAVLHGNVHLADQGEDLSADQCAAEAH